MQQNHVEESGAVLVMATFVAVFLVAVVYHVAGVGGGALEQNIMQDAADATVFSAATANARGMNILALINLIMAAILSVLVALRLIETLLAVATIIFAALCAIPWSAAVGCAAMEVTADLTVEVQELAETVEDVVDEILPVLKDTADVVNEVVPYLAEAEAVYISTSDEYSPPSQIGFVWPVFDGLPTKEGSFNTLCEHAAENVTDVAFFYLSDEIKDAIGDMVGDLATTFSSFFCGGDGSGGGRPSVERKTAVSHPWDERPECTGEDKTVDGSSVSGCYAEENSQGTLYGECDCGGRSDCESCSQAGCAFCFPKRGASNFENGLWTKSIDQWLEYFDSEDGPEDSNNSWRFEKWSTEDRRWTVQQSKDPCRGAVELGGCYSARPSAERRSLNLTSGDESPERREALCIHEEELDSYEDGSGRLYREVKRTSWLYLHSCEIEEEVLVEAAGDPVEGSDDKVPREVDMERYEQDSKMRSIVIGGGAKNERIRMVGVATDAASADNGSNGRVSFAAAEYYSPNTDLWHMNWRARLIRFRLSYDESEGGGRSEDGPFGNSGQGSCMEGFEDVCDKITGGLGSGGFDGLVSGFGSGLSPESYILH
jgi:hypothetical protein